MDYILNGLDTPYFLSLGKSFKMVMFRNIPMAWFWTLITPSECVCIFVCGHLCHWKDVRATEIHKDNTKALHLASFFVTFLLCFLPLKAKEESFLKFSYIKGLTWPIHLEDEMSFRDELFRPGGQNLAWKFVLRKEAEKFVLFWGLIFWGQNCAWGRNHNQDEINVLMTWLSNNFRRDINCIHFGFGFFAFSNWSCKTTSSVKKALQKGQCKGQLLGYRIVEIFSFEGRRGDFT